MGKNVLLDRVRGQAGAVEQFVAAERTRLVLLRPCRAEFGRQFAHALLSFLFRIDGFDR